MAPNIQFTDYNKLAQMAEQVFNELDLKDGSRDNKISQSIWNQYAAQFHAQGVEKISEKYINKADAIKLIATKVIGYFQAIADIKLAYHDDNPESYTGKDVLEEADIITSASDKKDILTGWVKELGLELSDEKINDVLSKYQAKIDLGFDSKKIEQDIKDYLHAKYVFNAQEDSFVDTEEICAELKENVHEILSGASAQEQALAIKKYLMEQNPKLTDIKATNQAVDLVKSMNEKYTIEGVKEALTYASEHPDDLGTAFKMQSEAFQRYGNSQVQLYDKNGDNKINREEFIAYESERSRYEFDDAAIDVAGKTFDYLAGSISDDGIIDAQEMALHGYATAKLFDDDTHKTAGDITFKEWLRTNNAITDHIIEGKNTKEFTRYEELKQVGMETLFYYQKNLEQQ